MYMNRSFGSSTFWTMNSYLSSVILLPGDSVVGKSSFTHFYSWKPIYFGHVSFPGSLMGSVASWKWLSPTNSARAGISHLASSLLYVDFLKSLQARILALNASYFLKAGGHFVISIKVRRYFFFSPLYATDCIESSSDILEQ
jgi:hypothetical protein